MESQFLLFIYFALVMTPPIVFATIFVRLDMFREPILPVVLTLIIGFAATSMFAEIKYSILDIPQAWYDDHFINTLFLIALPEELTKFFVIYFYCAKLQEFNEPMDGIVYGSLAGLGFAINEALFYAKSYQEESDTTFEVIDSILTRGLIAVPGHALDGIIMGAFLGYAMFRKVNLTLFILLAIIVPTLFHFLWDYSIFTGYGNFVYLIFFIQIIIAIVLFKKFRKLQSKKIIEIEQRIN